MRLTCPNCKAVYEVDEEAIPPGGRDVQCLDCGHGWFQTSLEPLAMPEDEDDEDDLPQGALPRPPPVDPKVIEVLREEAARELAARSAEARLAGDEPSRPEAESGAESEAPWEQEMPPTPSEELGTDGPERGFWWGFFLVLLLAGAGLALYLMADELGGYFPFAAAWLEQYAHALDLARQVARTAVERALGLLGLFSSAPSQAPPV